jgi:hypothetical protein
MSQEPISEQVQPPLDDDDEPTVPRIAAQRFPMSLVARVLKVRRKGTFRIAIDEQGFVHVAIPRQGTYILQPEEAFELLDLLFEYRNLLATRSAEIVERF